MRPSDFRQLIDLGSWRDLSPWGRSGRLLDGCRTAADFEKLARRRLPRSIADYVGGGADEEISLHSNSEAIRQWRFTPHTVGDVSTVDLTSELFGRRMAAPFGFAPTGYTKMIHVDGEPAVANVAAERGITYVISTMSATSIEDIRAAAPEADLWFQLYLWRDRDVVRELLRRAEASRCRVLEVAVDTPVAGNRLRDARNGLSIPPRIGLKTIADIAVKPAYWAKLVTRPMMTFANFVGSPDDRSDDQGSAALNTIAAITSQFEDAITWDDLAWLRDVWPGVLVVKGPLGPEEAVKARDLGFDGVHLSNHGGRQLDRAIAPIDLVRPVRTALGTEPTLLVDSGFRTGADIATAVALGADAVFLGKSYLWALAAGGSEGVRKLGSVLFAELERTMKLLGVTSVDELRADGGSFVTRPAREKAH